MFSIRKLYGPVLDKGDLGTFLHQLKLPTLAPEVPRKKDLASMLRGALQELEHVAKPVFILC